MKYYKRKIRFTDFFTLMERARNDNEKFVARFWVNDQEYRIPLDYCKKDVDNGDVLGFRIQDEIESKIDAKLKELGVEI